MKFVAWIVLVVICLVIAGGLGYFKYGEIQAGIEMGKAFPEPVETVEVVIARQSVYQPTTRVTGEVVAPQTANLTNELPGRINEVGFAPGARVSKGQLLLALDTSEEAARLRAAEAAQEIARLGFDRSQRMVVSGAGSVEGRDQARAEFDAAQANTQTLQAIIGKKRIKAPFDATTSLHTLEVGQYLASNTTVAQLVGTGGQTWIDFALPQQQANSVAGEFVQVSRGGTPIGQAKIIARDAAIDANSRNLSFRTSLETDPSAGYLYPGTLVSVDVSIGELQNVVAVPATAIRRSTLGTVVYVVGTNDNASDASDASEDTDNNATESQETRAQRRSVIVGSSIDFDPITQQQMVVIKSGLVVGERIAANGAFKLRDGIKVNLLERQPAGDGE